MAVVSVAFYRGLADANGLAQAPKGPALLVDQVTIGGAAESAAAPDGAHIVELEIEAACHTTQGPTGTVATTADPLRPAGGYRVYGCEPGDVIAVITV